MHGNFSKVAITDTSYPNYDRVTNFENTMLPISIENENSIVLDGRNNITFAKCWSKFRDIARKLYQKIEGISTFQNHR